MADSAGCYRICFCNRISSTRYQIIIIVSLISTVIIWIRVGSKFPTAHKRIIKCILEFIGKLISPQIIFECKYFLVYINVKTSHKYKFKKCFFWCTHTKNVTFIHKLLNLHLQAACGLCTSSYFCKDFWNSSTTSIHKCIFSKGIICIQSDVPFLELCRCSYVIGLEAKQLEHGGWLTIQPITWTCLHSSFWISMLPMWRW